MAEVMAGNHRPAAGGGAYRLRHVYLSAYLYIHAGEVFAAASVGDDAWTS